MYIVHNKLYYNCSKQFSTKMLFLQPSLKQEVGLYCVDTFTLYKLTDSEHFTALE